VRIDVKDVAHRPGCSTATIYRYLARITEDDDTRPSPDHGPCTF